MNLVTQIVLETMYYAALWAKPLKSSFQALDIGLSKDFPTFLWGKPNYYGGVVKLYLI